MINMQKILDETRVPLAEGAERPRAQSDPENFMELKNFCNKYREKLFRKSDIQQTMVDKLLNRNALAARKDKIDFDLPHFQLFCLEGNKGAKFDNRQVLSQRKRLTRPKLYTQFLQRRPVEARKIKEKPTELLGADDLLAPEYSTIPRSALVEKHQTEKSKKPKRESRSDADASLDDDELSDEVTHDDGGDDAQEEGEEETTSPTEPRWEDLVAFMNDHYPELFYTEMSAMYNNPEARGAPAEAASDPAGEQGSQEESAEQENEATAAAEDEGVPKGAGVWATLLKKQPPTVQKKQPARRQYQRVVEVCYDSDFDKIHRVVENRRAGAAGSYGGGKKSRKNNWDEGSQPVSAKAKRFDQFYQARVKAAAGSIEPQLLKQRQRKERIQKKQIIVDIDLDSATAVHGGSKQVKQRFDCVTVD